VAHGTDDATIIATNPDRRTNMGAIRDKLRGKVMQIEGRLTGDKTRIAEGTAVKAKGGIEAAASRLVSKVKSGARRVKAKVDRAGARARTR
jgi:uncharacterized protein YjbJ (UPF0337 family)